MVIIIIVMIMIMIMIMIIIIIVVISVGLCSRRISTFLLDLLRHVYESYKTQVSLKT